MPRAAVVPDEPQPLPAAAQPPTAAAATGWLLTVAREIEHIARLMFYGWVLIVLVISIAWGTISGIVTVRLMRGATMTEIGFPFLEPEVIADALAHVSGTLYHHIDPFDVYDSTKSMLDRDIHTFGAQHRAPIVEQWNVPEPVPAEALVSLYPPPHAPIDGRDYVYVRGVATLYDISPNFNISDFSRPDWACSRLLYTRNGVHDVHVDVGAITKDDGIWRIVKFTAPLSIIIERASGNVTNVLRVAHVKRTDSGFVGTTHFVGKSSLDAWVADAVGDGFFCSVPVRIPDWRRELTVQGPLTQAVADEINAETFVHT